MLTAVVTSEPRKALQNHGSDNWNPTPNFEPIQPVKANSSVLITRVNKPKVSTINKQDNALNGGRRMALTRPNISASQIMSIQLP